MPNTPDNIKEIADKRYAICNTCEFRNQKSDTCKVCGCFCPTLSRAVTKKDCPKGKFKKATVDNKTITDNGLG